MESNENMNVENMKEGSFDASQNVEQVNEGAFQTTQTIEQDTISEPEYKITPENKTHCALAAIPIISWLIYLINKEDKTVVAMANQGFVMLLGIIGLNVINSIIGAFTYIFLISLCVRLLTSVIGVFSVIALIKACQGEFWKVPIASEIKIFK